MIAELDIVTEEVFPNRFSKICTFCVHKRSAGEHTCDAFPDGIPDEIWDGKNLHQSPYPGDHGIRFAFSSNVTDEALRERVLAGNG